MQRKENRRKISVNGRDFKIGIVVSQFNGDITEGMLRGAREALEAQGVRSMDIKVVRVPGAVEIPLAAQRLARTKKFDGLIAIGCVIKGETMHDYYVGKFAHEGILRVSLDYSIPVGLAVLTTNNLVQAKARAMGKSNKGKEAASAMLEMIDFKA